MSPRSDAVRLLRDYPYARLGPLLGETRSTREPLLLHVGEPKFEPPARVQSVIAEHTASWSRYPEIRGVGALREAIADWIVSRYGVSPAAIDPASDIIPTFGSKEGLSSAILTAVLRKAARLPAGVRPAVLMPNPLYHTVFGAALMAGADSVTMPLARDNGFLPDLARIGEADLQRAAAIVVCSPNNPTASVMDEAAIEAIVRLARAHDLIAIFDEAYSEIWFDVPPPGALGVAQKVFGGDFTNIVASNSLSKRSGVPGLRGGFLAGDREFVGTDVYLARAYQGPATPIALQDAQAALWRDETHVEEYRARYRALRDVADARLGELSGYRTPAAAFFVWLDVGDGAAAARALWRDEAIKVLPGEIMSRPEPDGALPGKPFIRLPLVYGRDLMEDAFARIAAVLAKSEAA